MSIVSDAILEMVNSLTSGFRRTEGRPGLWFCAQNPPNLHSFVVIQHSAKYRAIGVDVASSVLRSWDKQYGRHQLIRATGLQNVRLASGLTPAEEEYYTYTDDHLTTISLIRKHLVEYALPWFAKHAAALTVDPLVLCGMRATRQLPLPSLDELKQILRREAWNINATKSQRQETSVLAVHLLAWANERCCNGNEISL